MQTHTDTLEILHLLLISWISTTVFEFPKLAMLASSILALCMLIIKIRHACPLIFLYVTDESYKQTVHKHFETD